MGPMRGLVRAVSTAVGALVVAVAAVAVTTTSAGAAVTPDVRVTGALAAPHVYAGGGVLGFGAPNVGASVTAPLNSVVVAQAANPVAPLSNEGYWLASADGGVYTMGDAGFYGSLGALQLTGPIVAMAATPDGRGYWLAAMDGGVFAFGDAGFHGSMGGIPLNQPIVGMASTADGRGYWLVASDGGIFAFGDAGFRGSMGGTPLNQPIVGMASTGDGQGYWLVASDGGIFTFGDARFFGSLGNLVLNDPIDGMARTPTAVATTWSPPTAASSPWGTRSSGDRSATDSTATCTTSSRWPASPWTQGGGGYWLLDPDGFTYSFANPPDPAASPTRSAIVSVAAGQVGADPDTGSFCNPYGPCEEWCSLFATWVWERAGVPVPSYPFTGNIYDWAAGNTGVLPPWAPPLPGDAVLYGTGPWSTATSVHVGVVVQVWPDGAIVTVEGDAGPAPSGSLAVIINGPYLPSHSPQYNGVPVYAFAQP